MLISKKKEKKPNISLYTRKLEIITGKKPSKHCQITCNFSSSLLFFFSCLLVLLFFNRCPFNYTCTKCDAMTVLLLHTQTKNPTVIFFNYLNRRKKDTSLSLHLKSRLKALYFTLWPTTIKSVTALETLLTQFIQLDHVFLHFILILMVKSYKKKNTFSTLFLTCILVKPLSWIMMLQSYSCFQLDG